MRQSVFYVLSSVVMFAGCSGNQQTGSSSTIEDILSLRDTKTITRDAFRINVPRSWKDEGQTNATNTLRFVLIGTAGENQMVSGELTLRVDFKSFVQTPLKQIADGHLNGAYKGCKLLSKGPVKLSDGSDGFLIVFEGQDASNPNVRTLATILWTRNSNRFGFISGRISESKPESSEFKDASNALELLKQCVLSFSA